MPLSVSISRLYEENKELIKIEEVLDVDGNDISKLFFELSHQTMSDPAGFWLDTGEFKLGRRS